MSQVSSNAGDSESRIHASDAASGDLVPRARALLREERYAEQTYRHLARELNDPSADMVFNLLLRETEERRLLMQRIIDGALGDASVGSCIAEGSARLRTVCIDIQELARGNRRHAQQLRDLACTERGRGHAPLGAILDTLARDCDKDASLLLELSCCLRTPDSRPT